jgi:hypothetical protein
MSFCNGDQRNREFIYIKGKGALFVRRGIDCSLLMMIAPKTGREDSLAFTIRLI